MATKHSTSALAPQRPSFRAEPLTAQQLRSLDAALLLIRAEVIRAARKHGGRPFASPHEGYGILAEEFDEFWTEVKANNAAAALDEVTQVGAMAAFYLTSFAAEVRHG